MGKVLGRRFGRGIDPGGELFIDKCILMRSRVLALRTGRRFLVVSGWSVVVGLFDHDGGSSTIDY